MRGDEAMCAVEILDRRNHEYSCSGCMMTLPVEVVNTMLAGRLTRCVSCSCIVYTEEENFLGPPPKPPGKSKAAEAGREDLRDADTPQEHDGPALLERGSVSLGGVLGS